MDIPKNRHPANYNDPRPAIESYGPPADFDMDGMTPIQRLERSRPGFEQLITTMAPDIRARRWDTLVGDDASGRVTTLLLRNVIGRAYAEQGYPAPHTYFVAMGQSLVAREEEAGALKNYMASGTLPRRALFVTDTVITGNTVTLAQQFLDELAIPNDIASAQAEPELLKQASQPHINRQPDSKIYTIDNEAGIKGQPLHAGRMLRPRWRAAIGVERYHNPTTEVARYHVARQALGRELRPGDHIPHNPDIPELRHAINHMASELYDSILG